MMKFLDGYKTYLGGAGFIMSGLGAILVPWYEGSAIDYQNAFNLIWIGITIIGGRSYLKKKNGY